MTHFAHFAKIFAHLAEYRGQLMIEAETKGWPLIRQMVRQTDRQTDRDDLIMSDIFSS